MSLEFNIEEKIEFNAKIELAEKSNNGEIEGILVKYNNNKLAHGRFRFSDDSLKINNNKTLFILWQHDGNQIPVGTMKGTSDKEGFKIVGNLDLSLLENGNPVNPSAHALYSLMKKMGANFDMSVGGFITEYTIIEEDDRRFVSIKEFDAYEGSIVMRGAVEGSKITNVFSLENKNITGEEQGMSITKEEVQAIFSQGMDDKFKKIEDKLFGANNEKSVNELKESFSTFEKEFRESTEATQSAYEEKFDSINNVIKSLKDNFKQERPEEFGLMEELYAVFTQVEKTKTEFFQQEGQESTFDTSVLKNIKFAATTTALPDAIKPTYVSKIVERLQASNPLLGLIDFMSITDNSLKLTREEVGLPTTGIVGETATRTETTTVTLDDVVVEMYQWYVLPVVSNRLLATNYIGYLPFLMMRAEYAMALNIANKLLAGTGTNQPTGVLVDTAVTNEVDFDITASTGLQLDDGAFAKQIKSVYYSVRDEISSQSVWAMRRGTWEYIVNLQNADSDFYMSDLTRVAARTLMTRPVMIVEDDNSGLSEIGTATSGDHIMVFGDFKNGIQGVQNPKLSISLEDKLTSKGLTKYWIEKGLGFGVKLPENFVKVTVTK